MKYLYLYLLFLVCTNALAQNETNVAYTEDHSIFPNPERGFYRHTETSATNYQPLEQVILERYRTEQGITQILRVFYLENFKEGPISESYLKNIRKDFNTIRKAGLKVIIRFAYTKKSSAPYGDAPLETVVTHINQLKPIFEANQDVIAVVQAGFVGAWGEWYYTDHFSENLGNPTEEDWANRRALVYALLDALPKSRNIQLRTPAIKMNITEDQTALTAEEAFSASSIARLAHHNDCFVASVNDFGTYGNQDVEKPYLEQETKYLPMGGETCALASPYSDCENATSELERFHWSYLNINYNTDVLDAWEDQGCFDEVERKLGYRYELIEATASTEVKPGHKFTLDLSIENIGYANPYNKRLVEVVLKHQTSGEEYFVATDLDPRLWSLDGPFNLTISAVLPESIPEGTYDVYINMPDPMHGLYGRPEYAIRFANENVWNADLGYNDLGMDLLVSNEATETGVDDEALFILRSAAKSPSFDAPGSIRSGASNDEIVLFWSGLEQGLTRIIERATNDGSFGYHASIPGNIPYFIDIDVLSDNTYHYRFYIKDNDKVSTHSDTVSTSLTAISDISITVDGEADDWGATPPIATSTNEHALMAARTYFGIENAYFALYGTSDQYAIYLNTDNSEQTGIGLAESGLGYDFVIQNDSLFEAVDGSWTYTNTTVEKGHSEELTEISIGHSYFSNLKNNPSIGIAVVLTRQGEPVVVTSPTGSATLYVRALAPEVPEGLQLSKSSSQPQSSLKLTWSSCTSCFGYTVERSKDGVNFEEIASFDKETTSYFEYNLLSNTTYYYRMNSHNDLGISGYSEVVSATTAGPLGIDMKSHSFYPNPSDHVIHVSEPYENLEIHTLTGRVILKSSYQRVINISHLKNGIYLLRLQTSDGYKEYKFIKN